VQRSQSVLEEELAQCGVEDVEAEVLPAEEVAEEAQGVVHHAAEALVQDEAGLEEALVLDVELHEEVLLAPVEVVSVVAAEAHKSSIVLRSAWRSVFYIGVVGVLFMLARERIFPGSLSLH
jgi:hypothetical protein